MSSHDLEPDEALIKQIFPNSLVQNVSPILQTWDKCVFRCDVQESDSPSSNAVIVRLETEPEEANTNFVVVAELQKLAAVACPQYVPLPRQVGRASNNDGTSLLFSVVDFVEGVTLQDVWPQLSAENQGKVVEEIVGVVKSLQSVRLTSEILTNISTTVMKYMGADLHLDTNLLGGPHTGFLSNGPSLLEAHLERLKMHRPFCSIERDSVSGDSTVQPSLPELDPLLVKKEDMDAWPASAVLCHNDLTPRNIMLKEQKSDSVTEYRLAAVIDWEFAGFYPPAYQQALQDAYLGNGNQLLSFYLKLKRQMLALIPRSPSQLVLAQALVLVYDSRVQVLFNGFNVPARIRHAFLHMMSLSRDSDPYLGWTCTTIPAYDAKALQDLETRIIDEVVAHRKAKAKQKASLSAATPAS